MKMSEYPPIRIGDIVGMYVVHEIWGNQVLILDIDGNMHTISYKELCSIRERAEKSRRRSGGATGRHQEKGKYYIRRFI